MSRKLTIIVLVILMLIAASVRIWGIGWGLPTNDHLSSYSPAENRLFDAALSQSLFDSGVENGGGLFINLFYLKIFGAIMLGLVQMTAAGQFFTAGDLAKIYLIGRLVVLFFGIATVYLTYLLGKRAYGKNAGICAALLMAVMPLHVMHSKLIGSNVLAAFFVTAALIFALRIADGNRLRDYLLAGLFAGLAAGTQYFTLLVLISPLIAHMASHKARPILRIISPKLLAVLPMAALGIFIGNPTLNFSKYSLCFTEGILGPLAGIMHSRLADFAYPFTHSLPFGVGFPFLVLAVIGLIYALVRRTPSDRVMAGFVILYLAFLVLVRSELAGQLIPILPVLAILASRFGTDVTEGLVCKGTCSKVTGAVVVLVLTGIFFVTLEYSFSIDYSLALPDTRDRALAWMKANIPEGSSIGVPIMDFTGAPPLGANVRYTGKSQDILDAKDELNYDLLVKPEVDWDVHYLQQTTPDYVMVFRGGASNSRRSARPYLNVLNDDYMLSGEFKENRLRYSWLLPMGTPPSDMSFIDPMILIYSRKVE